MWQCWNPGRGRTRRTVIWHIPQCILLSSIYSTIRRRHQIFTHTCHPGWQLASMALAFDHAPYGGTAEGWDRPIRVGTTYSMPDIAEMDGLADNLTLSPKASRSSIERFINTRWSDFTQLVPTLCLFCALTPPSGAVFFSCFFTTAVGSIQGLVAAPHASLRTITRSSSHSFILGSTRTLVERYPT